MDLRGGERGGGGAQSSLVSGRRLEEEKEGKSPSPSSIERSLYFWGNQGESFFIERKKKG